MKISVIVSVYNGSKYIKKTLDSILSQSMKDLEVLVVDDGSTDDSAKIIKSFEDSRVKYFYQKNSGSPAGPRNLAITKSTGEFIAFCDQDDIWYPEKLEKQIQTYEKCVEKERVGVVFSSADLIDENDRKIAVNRTVFDGYVEPAESNRRLLCGDFIIACSAVVPRSMFDEFGKLDESLKGVDDYDMWLRITTKYGLLAISEPLCAWRQTQSAMSRDKAKQYIETEKIFDKLADKTESIRVGHGKNLFRIGLASMLAKQYDVAKTYTKKLEGYPMSSKAKMITATIKISNKTGYLLVSFLQKIGKVSL